MTELEIKAAIRARDGYRCTECDMTEENHRLMYGRDLEVHRNTPGSEYSLEDGVCTTLCNSCHGPKPRQKRGAKGNKIVVMVKPTTRDAIRFEAALNKITIGEVLDRLVEAHLVNSLESIRKFRSRFLGTES